MKKLIGVLAFVFTLPLFAQRLYITNERAGTLQVVDTKTDTVIARATLKNRPRGIVVSPDGKHLYVALSWWRDHKHPVSGKEGILAIDAQTLRITRQYLGGTDPECVAVSPNGQRLYLSNEDAGTASIIDVSSGAVRATLITGTEPEGVAASPDGRWVYITAETSNTITVIDAKKEEVSANILVDARPRFALFSRNSQRAWLTSELGRSLTLIDVTKHKVIKRLKLGKLDLPVGIAATPDEKTLYIAAGRANGVIVVDAVAMKATAFIPVGQRVWGITITKDGKKVYAANNLSNSISVIDTKTNKVIKTIPTDDGPWGLAIR